MRFRAYSSLVKAQEQNPADIISILDKKIQRRSMLNAISLEQKNMKDFRADLHFKTYFKSLSSLHNEQSKSRAKKDDNGVDRKEKSKKVLVACNYINSKYSGSPFLRKGQGLLSSHPALRRP
jgi:hypothetical protein